MYAPYRLDIVPDPATSRRTVSAGCDSASLTTAYASDANGVLIGVIYPSGDAAGWTRTTDGLVTAVAFTPKGGSAQTLASNVTYAPYGPLTGATLPSGLTLTRGYDQDYRQTGLQTAALINASFGWQADGRIASVTDNLIPAQGPSSRTPAFTYAATGRIASASGPWGSQGWSFDGAGNLASATAGAAPAAQTLGWTYDAAGLMATASAGGTGTGAWAYRYDGLRAWRAPVGAPTQTAYVYDLAGQTLAEANAATGAASKEYIWLGRQLLGVAIPGGALYAATTGQNDEPQALTDPTGALAWSGYAQPFGATTTFAAPSVGLDLGYPGQWSQPEAANLARNGVRDYDPGLGRYAEPDPLGIDAGQNPYSYVDGDPLNETDPRGLAGIGVVAAGDIEGGVGAVSAGESRSVGGGVFGGGPNGLAVGGFRTRGSFTRVFNCTEQYPQNPGGKNDKFALGAFAGFGFGGFLTNATRASQLKGPFDTYTAQVGLEILNITVQVSVSGGIGVISATAGPGLGLDVSAFPTNTTIQ